MVYPGCIKCANGSYSYYFHIIEPALPSCPKCGAILREECPSCYGTGTKTTSEVEHEDQCNECGRPLIKYKEIPCPSCEGTGGPTMPHECVPPPVYLDQEAVAFVQSIARKKKTDISTVVNKLIITYKRITEVIE